MNAGINITQTDIVVLIKDAIKQQLLLFKKALKNPSLDKPTRLHLQEMISRISAARTAASMGESYKG